MVRETHLNLHLLLHSSDRNPFRRRSPFQEEKAPLREESTPRIETCSQEIVSIATPLLNFPKNQLDIKFFQIFSFWTSVRNTIFKPRAKTLPLILLSKSHELRANIYDSLTNFGQKVS